MPDLCSDFSIALTCCVSRSYIGQGQGRNHWSTWLSQVVFQALDLCLFSKTCFCWVVWYGMAGSGWPVGLVTVTVTGGFKAYEWVRCRSAPANALLIEPKRGLRCCKW